MATQRASTSGNSVAVDASDAHHQAIRRRARDEIFHRAPAALCGDGESAVLVKTAGIAQFVDVLASRSQAELVPLLDRIGSRGIERQRAPLLELSQIGTNMVQVDRLGGRHRVRLVLD